MNSITTHKMKNRSLSFFLLFFIILLSSLQSNAHEFSSYSQPLNYSNEIGSCIDEDYYVMGLYVNDSQIVSQQYTYATGVTCVGLMQVNDQDTYNLISNITFQSELDIDYRGLVNDGSNFYVVGVDAFEYWFTKLQQNTSYMTGYFNFDDGGEYDIVGATIYKGITYIAYASGSIDSFNVSDNTFIGEDNTLSGVPLRGIAVKGDNFYFPLSNNTILITNNSFGLVNQLTPSHNFTNPVWSDGRRATPIYHFNDVWYVGGHCDNAGVCSSLNNTKTALFLFTELPDIIPPVFTQTPMSQSTFNNTLPSLDINATDNVFIDKYILNNSVQFNINQNTGIIGVITRLPGNYSLNVTVNDSSNNKATSVFNWEIKNFIIPPEPSPSEIADELTTFWTNFAISFGLVIIVLALILSVSSLLKRK